MRTSITVAEIAGPIALLKKLRQGHLLVGFEVTGVPGIALFEMQTPYTWSLVAFVPVETLHHLYTAGLIRELTEGETPFGFPATSVFGARRIASNTTQ